MDKAQLDKLLMKIINSPKNKIESYIDSFFFHAYFAFSFMKGVDYNMKENIMEYATAFATLSAGVLMLSFVPAALGIRQVQKAESFNKIADGHRMLSLAKTYDAKATAKAIKEVKKRVL